MPSSIEFLHFHHLLVVLLNPLTSPVHILLQVLQTHGPLVQPDVQRCDVTVASESGSQISTELTILSRGNPNSLKQCDWHRTY